MISSKLIRNFSADIPDENLEHVIVNAARRLERAQVPDTQLYIHFVQIGDDADAAISLRHLDDALSNQYGIRVCFLYPRHI